MRTVLRRVLTAGILMVVAACTAGLPQPRLRSLVSEQEERVKVAQLQRAAEQFRRSQQARLEQVVSRLLLAMPDSPRLTIELMESDEVNAYVGEGQIKVCLGILRFVQSDDELAVVWATS